MLDSGLILAEALPLVVRSRLLDLSDFGASLNFDTFSPGNLVEVRLVLALLGYANYPIHYPQPLVFPARDLDELSLGRFPA